MHCGVQGEDCCGDGKCRQDHVTCYDWGAQPVCGHCGVPGEPCCSDPSPQCDDGAACDQGDCPCGGENESCCNYDWCPYGGRTCENGKCVTPSEPPTPCNQTVSAGGDDPETIVVDLGSAPGDTVFTVNTFLVPDRIRVLFDGIQVPGADTGCIATHALACSGAATPGWYVDCYGEASHTIAYPGGATKVEVTVEPNCLGTIDTQWYFSLSCP